MARGRKKDTKSTMGKSLREQIMGTATQEEFKREVHVTTRLSENIVEIVDALVTLNVFQSRSEAVAAYLENSIMTNKSMYENIVKQARAVEGMRDNAMESVLETFQKSDR